MDQPKIYFSECQIKLNLSELEYLTVIPKDLRSMIFEHFKKDAILCEFINHLINSYLINVGYDSQFLNINAFKSKIIEILRDEFGDPFDFSKYKDELGKIFVEKFGQQEITDDLLREFDKKFDHREFFNDSLYDIRYEIEELFSPKLGNKLKYDGFYFFDIAEDLGNFIINNLLAENFELVKYSYHEYSSENDHSFF